MQQTCSLHVGNHLQTETGYFYFYLFKKKKQNSFWLCRANAAKSKLAAVSSCVHH